jgi:Transposase zinc-ribbon domain
VPIQLLITALGGLTAAEFSEKFPTEEACKSYLVALRWPDGVCCPRCGNPKVYKLSSQERQWQCEECSQDGYRFSHLVGTFFKNTNKPLSTWFRIIQLIAKEPEITAVRIRIEFGFGSYKTAWKMRNRIRAALNTRSGDVNSERAMLESQKDGAPAISDLPSLSPDMLKSVEAALALLDLLDSDSEGASLPDSADPGNQDI